MPYLDKSYTKQVRQQLRKQFPDFKFSVRTRDHMSLAVRILSGPLDLIPNSSNGNENVNQYHVDKHYEEFPEKRDFLTQVLDIMMQKHDSCVSTDGDYGNIPNFYIDLQIGKWDRPYEVK